VFDCFKPMLTEFKYHLPHLAAHTAQCTDLHKLFLSFDSPETNEIIVTTCVWVRSGGCIVAWWGNRWEGDHWGDLGVDGWIILGWICRRWDVGILIGLGWPRIETGGGRL